MNRTHILFSALLVALLSVSCQKEPSTSGLSNEYLIYTSHDTEASFSAFASYYVADSILLIGRESVDSSGHKQPLYWSDADALSLVNSFVAAMNSRGYQRLTDPAQRQTADVGLQLSYVESTTYFVGFNNPYWWSYYPYYWSPDYWGAWYGWYYPFAVAYYGYTTGSLLAEMVDLGAESGSGKSLPILWNAYVSGLVGDNGKINIPRTIVAIDEAFAQSPYLQK